MRKWNSLADVPSDFGPSVVTLGNFDGMHRGHRHLITVAVEHARQRQAKAAAITFYPHPAAVHQPERGLIQLQSLPDRLGALQALGLDGVLVVAYTLEFSRLTPGEFAQRYLADGFGAVEVVAGRDIRFGADNSGNLDTMRQLGQRLGFGLTVVEDQFDSADPKADRWSSSAVRQALVSGDAAQAARVLGRPHRVTGLVVHGDGRGRQLGFPTANLGGRITGLIPADGVYAGYIVRPGAVASGAGVADVVLPAAISVGVNPTFTTPGTAQPQRRVEAYALGRDDLDLYDQVIAVDFVARLRHTLAFADTAALVTQMRSDAAAAARILYARPPDRVRVDL
ncbi:MAG: bifunctional riboflavin kinase/FAD synthetase [Bifidobacteriaceae bacterium]|nr:bifunctional riboflavin kinase/FAD synthetase [Bifidobacteriaceae bacterium]